MTIYPDTSSISPTDSKILYTLTRELTAIDAATVSGIPYEYCKKRIGILKKKNLVIARQVGTQFFYRTIRLPETEEYFKQAETRSSDSIEFEFSFFGEFGNFNKHIQRVKAERDRLKSADANFLSTIYRIVCTLKVRSWNKSQGRDSQYPNEERIREYLIQRIALARKELALAEALYDARGLWSGKADVWKQISNTEPTAGVIQGYEDLGRMF